MQYNRSGENLWLEWSGYDLPTESEESIIYYTLEWVDVDDETVRRALASALQRSGAVEGLGHAFRSLETAHVTQAYGAHLGGEREWSFYDQEWTPRPDPEVEDFTAITWVEITVADY